MLVGHYRQIRGACLRFELSCKSSNRWRRTSWFFSWYIHCVQRQYVCCFELATLRVSKFKSGQRRLILLWCHSTEKEVVIVTRSSLSKLTCTELCVEEQIWCHINVLYSWYQWIEAVYYCCLLPRFRDTRPQSVRSILAAENELCKYSSTRPST